jgi:hypothetical protein
MDIVVIDWSIWLVMTHLIICQMGHLVKLYEKWYSWLRWPMDSSQMEHFVKLNKQKWLPTHLSTYLCIYYGNYLHVGMYPLSYLGG